MEWIFHGKPSAAYWEYFSKIITREKAGWFCLKLYKHNPVRGKGHLGKKFPCSGSWPELGGIKFHCWFPQMDYNPQIHKSTKECKLWYAITLLQYHKQETWRYATRETAFTITFIANAFKGKFLQFFSHELLVEKSGVGLLSSCVMSAVPAEELCQISENNVRLCHQIISRLGRYNQDRES